MKNIEKKKVMRLFYFLNLLDFETSVKDSYDLVKCCVCLTAISISYAFYFRLPSLAKCACQLLILKATDAVDLEP